MFLGLRGFLTRAQPKRAQRGLFGGKEIQFGNQISFSNKKHRRTWKPNVQTKTYYSDILQRQLKLHVTTYVMRWIDKVGGFDNYILHTKEKKLASELGMQLKSEMKQALANRRIEEASNADQTPSDAQHTSAETTQPAAKPAPA